MDMFLVKSAGISSEKKKKAHLPTKITASKRAKGYEKGTFHAQENRLFCTAYNVVIDHLRKCVVDKHLESEFHTRNEKRKQRQKHYTLKTVLNCKTDARVENVKTCHEWIKVCTAGNIPLYKTNNSFVREF